MSPNPAPTTVGNAPTRYCPGTPERPPSAIALALLAATGTGSATVAAQPAAQDIEHRLEVLEARIAEMAAGPAEESAATEGSWTFYGSLRVAAGRLDDGSDAGFNVFDRASRIGFRGSCGASEDHREGMSPEAFWQVESGINADAGSGELASRDTFVGLRGERRGQLRLGFFESPARRVGRHVDQIFSRTGDNRNLMRVDDLLGRQGQRNPGWDNRLGNALEYQTPHLAGFGAAVLVSSNVDEGFASATDTAPAISASITYDRGPLWVGLGFERIDEGASDFNQSLSDLGLDGLDIDETDRNNAPRLLRVGMSHDIGKLTLAAIYQNAKGQQGNDDWDRETFGLGASYRLDPQTRIAGQVYHADDMALLDDTGATLVAGELEHRINAQTRVYFAIAHTDNDDNAQFHSARGVVGDATDDAGTPRLGEASTSFSATLRHDF